MVERRDGLDAGGDEAVREVDVEVETGLVELARAGRLDAGPRDREPVGLQAEVLHDRDVLRRRGGSGRPRRRRCRRRAPCRACGENVSQMDGPRPSSSNAPSIWYEAVAEPQRKSEGNWRPEGREVVIGMSFGRAEVAVTVERNHARTERSGAKDRIDTIPVPARRTARSRAGQSPIVTVTTSGRRRPRPSRRLHGDRPRRVRAARLDADRRPVPGHDEARVAHPRHGAVAVGELDEAQRDAVGPVVVRPVVDARRRAARCRAGRSSGSDSRSRAARGPSAVRSTWSPVSSDVHVPVGHVERRRRRPR